MPKPSKTSAELVAAARGRIKEIDAGDAVGLVGQDGVLFVDLREPAEHQKTGIIPGAMILPRAFLELAVDPESPAHRPALANADRVVFYCGSGVRSALALAALLDMGYEAAHVKQGFGRFVAAGGTAHPI